MITETSLKDVTIQTLYGKQVPSNYILSAGQPEILVHGQIHNGPIDEVLIRAHDGESMAGVIMTVDQAKKVSEGLIRTIQGIESGDIVTRHPDKF